MKEAGMQWMSTDWVFVKCASRLCGCAVFDAQPVQFAPPKHRLCYKTNSEMNESESKMDHLQTRKTEINKQIRKNNDGREVRLRGAVCSQLF